MKKLLIILIINFIFLFHITSSEAGDISYLNHIMPSYQSVDGNKDIRPKDTQESIKFEKKYSKYFSSIEPNKFTLSEQDRLNMINERHRYNKK